LGFIYRNAFEVKKNQGKTEDPKKKPLTRKIQSPARGCDGGKGSFVVTIYLGPPIKTVLR
jgi:hypothetical protein